MHIQSYRKIEQSGECRNRHFSLVSEKYTVTHVKHTITTHSISMEKKKNKPEESPGIHMNNAVWVFIRN